MDDLKGLASEFEYEEESGVNEWLSETFEEQYVSKASLLNGAGLIHVLGSGEMGAVGVDGREYEIPRQEDIRKELLSKKRRDIYDEKIRQGFTELEIVPFASSIGSLMSVAEERLRFHYKNDQLFRSTKNLVAYGRSEVLELAHVDMDNPFNFYVEDYIREADEKEGVVLYYPETFDKFPKKAKTKKQILKEHKDSLFPGFNIYLRQPHINIPQKAGTKNDFVAGDTANKYMFDLYHSSIHKYEVGQTLEDWLVQLVSVLEEYGQVIEDYEGNGSENLLLGCYVVSPDTEGGFDKNNVLKVSYSGMTGQFSLELVGNSFMKRYIGTRSIVLVGDPDRLIKR